MNKSKRTIIYISGILVLIIAFIIINNIVLAYTPSASVVPPVFSSTTPTPGIYNQKKITSDYVAPTSTHSSDEFSFYYSTSDYSYGITTNGYEIISFINSDGTALDVLSGGGTFVIVNRYASTVSSSSQHVKSYELTNDNELTVYYDTKGGEQFTKYVFNTYNIEVTANVSFQNEVSNICAISLKRNFKNNYIDSEKKVTSDWIFPDNGDFPYRTFDGYVLTNYIDSTHKLYSFWREPAANPAIIPDYLPNGDLMVTTVPDTLSSYSLCYTLVFEEIAKDYDSDYYALFKGRSSELAVGITPTTAPESCATLFATNDISFNINITNIHDSDVEYNVKYCIYDYYGNMYNNSKDSLVLSSGSQINYLLKPSTEKYGIYYIDATVSYMDKEYRELYPFILYEHHDYEYTSTSPFGISGIRFGNYSPNDTTIFLADEMGIANMRVCFSLPDYIGNDYTLLQNYLAKLHANGTRITGQYLLSSNWTVPDDTERYASELATILSHVGSYLTDCEIGNENNYTASTINVAMSEYLKKQFDPTFSIVTDDYKLPIISAGVYLSKTDWLDAAVVAGLWDRVDILSTHAYSFPHSPDYTDNPTIEHSYESALVRIRNFMDTHGEKTWYMSEFGYHTTPDKANGLFSGSDLRSQADYTIREFILGLSYGVDVLESYSFIDGINTSKAMSDSLIECHYGMFYPEDYYGRLMPKPLAMSYMTMTKELDGYESCSEIADESSTSRIFEISLQQSDEPLYVCWSNCSRLSTDKLFSRTPGLPWENQWTSSEEITFYTDNYVSVTDFQGNTTLYYPKTGKVTIPVTGEPIIIKHASFEPLT